MLDEPTNTVKMFLQLLSEISCVYVCVQCSCYRFKVISLVIFVLFRSNILNCICFFVRSLSIAFTSRWFFLYFTDFTVSISDTPSVYTDSIVLSLMKPSFYLHVFHILLFISLSLSLSLAKCWHKSYEICRFTYAQIPIIIRHSRWQFYVFTFAKKYKARARTFAALYTFHIVSDGFHSLQTFSISNIHIKINAATIRFYV